jgi:hypothetical protein
VEVSRIHHYARNPRRQPNPEYARIKASIQAEGLDQPLVLSQKPGESEYVLHSGGNTRLKNPQRAVGGNWGGAVPLGGLCRQKLGHRNPMCCLHTFAKTNYAEACLLSIKPWAVFEAKALLEQELTVDSLSQRQVEQLFKERGFGLSHSMISKMGYAVEVLWPLMPKAVGRWIGPTPGGKRFVPCSAQPTQSGIDADWVTTPTSKVSLPSCVAATMVPSGISSRCTMHWSTKLQWNPNRTGK